MTLRQVLVLGNLRGTAKAAVDVARRETGLEVTQVSRTDEAILELDKATWSAVLVDLTTPGASRLCQEARARRALFNVPLIALSPKLTDLAFANAFRWGADDVVLLGAADPLTARLRVLPETVIPAARASRGEAVIADPDRGRCDVLGRVLANAGFGVKYATDLVSTRFYLSKPSVELFVLNADLEEPLALVKEARQAGSKAQWVITTKQGNVSQLRAGLGNLHETIVMSSHGPPENVLFALNLMKPSSGNLQRAEVRALHGSVVLFRSVGEDQDEYGFTYSVSATGLYIRSLLPPPAERLWLEIQPPNMPRRVRLVGRLAWMRGFGQAGAETAPPGFGVQIVDGLGKDLDLWLEGFNSLDIRTPNAHEVPELQTSSGSFRIPLPSNRPGRSEPEFAVPLRSPSLREMRAVTPTTPAATEPAAERKPAVEQLAASLPPTANRSGAHNTTASIQPERILGIGITPGPRVAPQIERPPAPPAETQLESSAAAVAPSPPPPKPSQATPNQAPLGRTAPPPKPLASPAAPKSVPPPAVSAPATDTPLPLASRRNSPPLVVFGGIAVFAIAGYGLYLAASGSGPGTAPPNPHPTGVPPSLEAAPPNKSLSKAPPSATLPVPPPTEPAAPATADPAEKPTPEEPSGPPGPPERLPSDAAYLYVESLGTSRVFVHGLESGETNAWLETKCGTRFIRLGSAPGSWSSKGLPYKLKCQSANRLKIDPDE